MTEVQDPNRQISYLQQCLSSDKRPLGLFLGAGCSMAIKAATEKDKPLVPGIEGMTQVICEQLSGDKECSPLLEKIRKHFKADGKETFNLEDMLSHIRGMRAVAGQDEVRGLSAAELDQLDEEICNAIYKIANQDFPAAGTPYHQIAMWTDDIDRENPVQIFTTNYDLFMELALEHCAVPYFDGFPGACKPFFDIQAIEEDTLPARWANVWKLHGSINWYQTVPNGVFRGATNETGSRRVIHPSHLKYEESRRMPYLAMMDQLRSFLKQPSAVLVVCGYSFRDQHINDVLRQGLRGNNSAIVFALLFGEVGSCSQAVSLAKEQANLSLLAKDGSVVGGLEQNWLQKDEEGIPKEATKWITWSPVDPKNKGSKLKAEFLLGDFVQFGDFLSELIGEEHQPMEST